MALQNGDVIPIKKSSDILLAIERLVNEHAGNNFQKPKILTKREEKGSSGVVNFDKKGWNDSSNPYMNKTLDDFLKGRT